MTGLTRFLRGYVRLQLRESEQEIAAFLNLLAEKGILFWDFQRTEAQAELCMLASDAQRLASLPTAPAAWVIFHRGVPQLLYRYRKRFGLALGAVLFCLILWLSGQFVWSVEVEGNETVCKEEIVSGLERLGCGVGAYLPHLDCYRLSKEYLLSEPRLSYAAVVRDGNVLTVRVRERQSPSPAEPQEPANLIAKEDGVIVSTALASGQRVVQAGETVRKGELLVSGFVENKTGSYTLTGAKGKVLARVTRELRVEIPFLQSEICRDQVLGSEKIIKIFGKSIKFSKMGGNLEGKYDTIREEQNIVLFGRVTLPISVCCIRYLKMEERSVTVSEAQAYAQAQSQLAQQQAELEQSAQILSYGKTVKTVTDTAVILTVRVHCITDIAQIQPILK